MGLVVWVVRGALVGACGQPSFYYGYIIAHSHLLVNSFCESFSRFNAIFFRERAGASCSPFAARFFVARSFSHRQRGRQLPQPCDIAPGGGCGAAVEGGVRVKTTRKNKKAFSQKLLTIA